MPYIITIAFVVLLLLLEAAGAYILHLRKELNKVDRLTALQAGDAAIQKVTDAKTRDENADFSDFANKFKEIGDTADTIAPPDTTPQTPPATGGVTTLG